MSRSHRAWVALGLALLWFAGPAHWLAHWLQDARAEDLRSPTIDEPVQAVLLARGEELPRGAEAADLADRLEQTMALHEGGHWLEAGLGLLDEEQLERIREGSGEPPLPRSRSHPQTPAELVALIDVLTEQAGSATAPMPARPARAPLPDLASQQKLTGLLSLAQDDGIRDQQVPELLACALAGVQAHEAVPRMVDDLLESLHPDTVKRLENHPPLDRVQGLSDATAQALARLRAR